MDDENKYLRLLTCCVGDLIHYREHELKRDHPKCAQFFDFVGLVLRHLSSFSRGDETVNEALKKGHPLHVDHYDLIDGDELLVRITNCNSCDLVNMVCEIEGLFIIEPVLGKYVKEAEGRVISKTNDD